MGDGTLGPAVAIFLPATLHGAISSPAARPERQGAVA